MHGGKRNNAGRPKGRNKYGEATVPIRIPLSKVKAIRRQLEHGVQTIPFYSSKVSAGFPLPVEDHLISRINLNDYLINNMEATFMVRATGDSMIDAGIDAGDILVVDRSIKPIHNKIVIAVVDHAFTVKRLAFRGGVAYLCPENKQYKAIEMTGEDMKIWGVVTYVIRQV